MLVGGGTIGWTNLRQHQWLELPVLVALAQPTWQAFTALAGLIADALSPWQTNSGATDSSTKAVNFRGKYIQQLKELVDYVGLVP